jgi:hypothetical protein
MRLTWLPEVLRAAGLTVHEVSGWRTRGSSSFDPHGIICHETRGSKTSTDAGEIHTLLNGSATAPPPIAQLYLSRTGHWHVIASGRCNHVRVGWAGPFKGVGNSGLVGIEAQHALNEPWTDRQYDSYVRGVRALHDRTGWGIAGHKEHQPAGYGQSSVKTDPSFNMDQFRRDVTALTGKDFLMALTDAEQKELLAGVRAIRTITNVAGYRVAALISGSPTYNDQMGNKSAVNTLAEQIRALVAGQQAILTASEIDPAEVDRIAAALPVPPTAAEIAEETVARLGGGDLDAAADALRAAFGDRLPDLVALLGAAEGQARG